MTNENTSTNQSGSGPFRNAMGVMLHITFVSSFYLPKIDVAFKIIIESKSNSHVHGSMWLSN
jgi:hypothetical protein